jgi:hypothetical protein
MGQQGVVSAYAAAVVLWAASAWFHTILLQPCPEQVELVLTTSFACISLAGHQVEHPEQQL